MRLDRLLVPLGAAILIGGLVVALLVARNRPPQDPVADLLAIKSEAESLAIEGRLAEAHAKYRELFARAQGRDLKGPLTWDMLDRAKTDQDRIYTILLNERDAGARPATLPTYPPYPNFDRAAAGTRPAETRNSARTTEGAVGTTQPATMPASQPATRPAGENPSTTPATATTGRADVVPPETQPALAPPKKFKVARTPRDPAGFSDALVGYSLRQGADFLLAQFKDGEVQQGRDINEVYHEGLNALCVYALLATGQATHDPRLAITSPLMKELVARMKLHAMASDREKQMPVVYARSIRATALALYNRPEDQKLLKDDVEWLINAAQDGAYTYDDRFVANIIKDPRARPPTKEPPATLPAPWEQDPKKPKRLSRDVGSLWAPTPLGVPLCDETDAPILLADGRHDPRTGRELDPPLGLRRRYPTSPMPLQPPQYPVDKYTGRFVWDNSNSQYGVMGVWSGAQTGIEVPDAYWAAVQKHWMSCQLPSGEWPYQQDRPGGYLAMTCAGVASMMVTLDQLEAPSVSKVGRLPSPGAQVVEKGLAWLEQEDNAVSVTGPRTVYLGYTLHALSRVGLASGYKYLGDHDWYRELSKKIVLSQWENGSWGRTADPNSDTLIDTAYTMLFLARGRHPVMMNKLRLETLARDPRGERVAIASRGTWNNRPRDLANLAQFAGVELERAVNWQIVGIDRNPAEWSDAPVVYFASHQALKLTPDDIGRLRSFAMDGGLIFTQCDDNAASFGYYLEQLAKTLFPGMELKDLPADHDIYTCQYQIPAGKRPRLKAVSNGSRLLWVHSPTDLAIQWQQRAVRSKREAFEMGINLFVYAAGKADLRNRIDDRIVPAPGFAPQSSVKLARLRYRGNWNPEPSAFAQFAKWLMWETGVGLVIDHMDLAQLKPGAATIAHLSGTTDYVPTPEDLAALRAYVEAGGTLIVEPVGGRECTFDQALQGTILPLAFKDARFEAIDAAHPMLKASFEGMDDVWPPRLRPYAEDKVGKVIPPIRMATLGKGRVIYLPLDVTTGLLGCGAWPVMGYDVRESQALMKNIVLWTMEQQP